MTHTLTASTLIFTISLGVAPAWAADDNTKSNAGDPAITVVALPVVTVEKRPAALPVLYAGLIGLQAYDIYSTNSALSRGGSEANPLVAPMAGQTAAMIVMKAVSTGTTIALTERLWHRNRTAAILTMVAANGVVAIVAAHNARVLQQLR